MLKRGGLNYMNNFYKKTRHFFITFIIKITEKNFKFAGHKVKYIYEDNKKSNLCIVFSGFPELGKKAEYNYKRTLHKYKDFNYLFILDDMVNIPTGGSYYLGSNGNYWGLKAIPELINMIQKKCKCKVLVMTGSSKGGTCALLYGARLGADYIIAGSCQYKIGSYMLNPYHINSLKVLTGVNDIQKEAVDFLDSLCYESLKNNVNKDKTKVYLHYSDKEETYEKHIKYLVQDLNDMNYFVTYEIMNYENHGDVGKYFPKFLLKTLSSIH